jgi:hypothetical protein
MNAPTKVRCTASSYEGMPRLQRCSGGVLCSASGRTAAGGSTAQPAATMWTPQPRARSSSDATATMLHSPREMQRPQRQRRDEGDRTASRLPRVGSPARRAAVKDAAPNTGWAAATSARPSALRTRPTAGASSSDYSGREVAAPPCARHDDAASKRTPRAALRQRLQRKQLSASIGRLLRLGAAEGGRAVPHAPREGPRGHYSQRAVACAPASQQCAHRTTHATHTRRPPPPKQQRASAMTCTRNQM